MKKTCAIVRDLLPLYRREACSADSAQLVQEHLATCETCRNALQEMDSSAEPPTTPHPIQTAPKSHKKGRQRAFRKGCLLLLQILCVCLVVYYGPHWLNTASISDKAGLTRQARKLLQEDTLEIVQMEQRGDWMAALCSAADEESFLCVYERDPVFSQRWQATSGTYNVEPGTIGSWHLGVEGTAVLIFGGTQLPDAAQGYTFTNGKITYYCPVEDHTVLDVFVILDEPHIEGMPQLLDENRQPLRRNAANVPQ